MYCNSREKRVLDLANPLNRAERMRVVVTREFHWRNCLTMTGWGDEHILLGVKIETLEGGDVPSWVNMALLEVCFWLGKPNTNPTERTESELNNNQFHKI